MDLTLVKYLTALFMQVQVAINPAAAHTGSPLEVANSAALAVAQSKPLSGISKEELVSVLAVLAWHEGKNNPNAIGTATCNASGDCSSYSTWQLDHRPETLGDSATAARYALYIVIAGYRNTPLHPLCGYAGSCRNAKAIGIADDRLKEARAALQMVQTH